MKRILFFAFAFAAFLVLPHTLHAQTMQEGQLTLHAGAFFPQGEFGSTDEDDDDSGFATTGFTVVGEYTYPVGGTPGLGIIGTISLSANGFNEDELLEGSDLDGVSSGYWINVPIMAGAKYEEEVSPDVDLYGLGQIGVNVNNGPKIENESGDDTRTISFSQGTSLGFTIGVGAAINNQVDVGLRYQDLGTPQISIEAKEDGDTINEYDKDQPLAGIQLLVGIDI